MLLPVLLAGAALTPSQDVDFDADVRPLLAERCFACHGPDQASRAAGLRLDTREGATADRGGYAALAPGDIQASELWLRVTSDEDAERMPPPEAHAEPFDAQELEVLRAWIEAGAPWAEHWAFVAPARPESEADTAHPIDQLVRRRLAEEALDLAPRAGAATLARRLSFDLTGLPPTPEELRPLGDAPSDEAWAGYIDAKLASVAHAERLAMWWLDAARYADTDGYQQDETRSNWVWRDWVIDAFHANMPFDRFTELQFAGDLLPDASPEDVLATCFHRNHMHNGEGGRDPAESRVDYVRDRVNTVGAVWLGLTLECAQCHDHKFDPVSQAEYYSLTALFDSIDEDGRAGGAAGPFLDYASPKAAATLERVEEDLAAARAVEARLRAESEPGFAEWLRRAEGGELAGATGWTTVSPRAAFRDDGGSLDVDSDGTVRRRAAGAEKEEFTLEFDALPQGPLTGIALRFLRGEDGRFSDAEDGEFILTGVRARVVGAMGETVRLHYLRSAHAEVVGKGVDALFGAAKGAINDDPRTGWTTREAEAGDAPRIVLGLDDPLQIEEGQSLELRLLFLSTVNGAYARDVQVALTAERGDAAFQAGPTPREALAAALTEGAFDRPLRERLLAQYLDHQDAWRDATRRTRRLEARRSALERSTQPVKATVLRERAEPRTTWVLERGEWDQHGAVVEAGVPPAVAGFDADVTDRLQLARWLTDPRHPLTARVIANQLWQLCFGRGLVATPADFGAQGARPVHEDVLDWLAVELVESGWDLRHVLRAIVTSETYRQSSVATADQRARDPENELLARGARYRLPSWMIRDAALAASGLLDPTVGGLPVYPHQPPGVWEEMFMGRWRYQPTLGRTRHRRSLYAFWRRNVAPTYFFDMADRRNCEVGVRRTNTPLQALVLLNDRVYVDAARALAKQARERAAEADVRAGVEALCRSVLSRSPTPEEDRALVFAYQRAHQGYKQDLQLAAAAARPSDLEAVATPDDGDPAELAGWMAVAAVLLNLDEAITHE